MSLHPARAAGTGEMQRRLPQAYAAVSIVTTRMLGAAAMEGPESPDRTRKARTVVAITDPVESSF